MAERTRLEALKALLATSAAAGEPAIVPIAWNPTRVVKAALAPVVRDEAAIAERDDRALEMARAEFQAHRRAR